MKLNRVLLLWEVAVAICLFAFSSALWADHTPEPSAVTVAGNRALAWLRFDRATGPMTAGDATITWQS